MDHIGVLCDQCEISKDQFKFSLGRDVLMIAIHSGGTAVEGSDHTSAHAAVGEG